MLKPRQSPSTPAILLLVCISFQDMLMISKMLINGIVRWVVLSRLGMRRMWAGSLRHTFRIQGGWKQIFRGLIWKRRFNRWLMLCNRVWVAIKRIFKLQWLNWWQGKRVMEVVVHIQPQMFLGCTRCKQGHLVHRYLPIVLAIHFMHVIWKHIVQKKKSLPVPRTYFIQNTKPFSRNLGPWQTQLHASRNLNVCSWPKPKPQKFQWLI